MAIDTQAKRASCLQFGRPWIMVLPDPDGTIDQADRQHLLRLYSGITVIETILITFKDWTLRVRSLALSLQSRSLAWALRSRALAWSLPERGDAERILITEAGDVIITEGGDEIIME